MASILINKGAFRTTKMLYLNKDLADVHFLFNDGDAVQKVPANKAILAIRSPVFYRMFFGVIKEKGDVEIVDADVDSFKEFLQIFYLNKVKLSMENMKTVVRLADKYDVLRNFTKAYAKMISKLTMRNICWGYQLALYLKHEASIKYCEDKISHSPKGIFASDSFNHCEWATLKRILELNLTCYECDILKASLTWAKQACRLTGLDENNSKNLKSQLGDCLKSIRFGEIRIRDFMELTIAHDGLFLPEEFQDIVRMITLNGYDSKLFNSNAREYKWGEDEKECITMHRGNWKLKCTDRDIVSFTSNQPALLGRIYAPAVKSPWVEFDVKLIVMQLDEFYSKNSEKILYDGTFKVYHERLLEIDLPQSILIKAHTLYEIHLTVPNYTEDADMSVFEEWDFYGNTSQMSLDSNSIEEIGFEIDFYENPRLNYNNSCEGWISHIDFRPI